MNERGMSGRAMGAGGGPFSVRGVLALVVFGAAVFVALLWMIGAGMTAPSGNNGGGHAAGKGLNGYAALVQLLDRRGYRTALGRGEADLVQPGLLVLTPPQDAKGTDIEKIVAARRHIGPTLVISPKWAAVPVPASATKGKRGWVILAGTAAPRWEGFLDEVSVHIGPGAGRWTGAGVTGALPVPATIETGQGRGLEPLVMDRNGGMLAAYLQDGGYYPVLENIALQTNWEAGDDDIYPLIVVFEPDLLDNYGMAGKENARLADRLISAALAGNSRTVTFDVTLNGLGRSPNLLTLAFTPPYLAATLCLLLVALAAGWRAFLRFGPPLAAARAVPFGKRPLVSNAAGLIRRTRRLHLVTRPYADHLRERIARTLGLPRQPSAEAAEAAIDKALALRLPGSEPFSTLAAALRAARRPAHILRAAQALHRLERNLSR